MSKLTFVTPSSLLLACIIAMNSTVVQANLESEVNTQSGLTLKSKTSPATFKISGLVKLDGTFFSARSNFLNHKTKAKAFENGLYTNIRALELAFNGDFTQNWAYKIGFSILNRMDLKEANISYKNLIKNSHLSLGQVTSAFGLENTCSSKWQAFLERSMAISAFERGYGYGLGANARYWNERFVAIVAAIQPKENAVVDKKNPTRASGSDKWGFSSRFIFVPLNTPTKTFHVGVSLAHQNIEPIKADGQPLKTLNFSVPTEGRARKPQSYVETGNMQARNFTIFGLETTYQEGPLHIKLEWLKNYVQRVGLPKAIFNAWTAEFRYVLTGEQQQYDGSTASFGQIKPRQAKGAIEVAARVDGVNLNFKDILGGRQNNYGLALNWYIDNNVKLSSNLIHSHIHPQGNKAAQKLNMLGFRAQYVW